MKKSQILLLVGASFFLPASASAQLPSYAVEYMGPGYGTMNNAGVVIGNDNAVYPGTPWINDGTGLQYLPLPGNAVAGSVADINDAGVIVGAIDTDDDYINDAPIKWTPDGQGGYVVEALPLAGSALRAHAVAINNHGVILASGLAIGSLPTYTAYVIDGETVTHVGVSNPMDINDNGIILTNNQLYDYYNAVSLGFGPLPPEVPQGYLYPASINNYDEVIVNILTTIIGHTRYHAIGIYTVGVGWDLFMNVQTIYTAGSINDVGDVTLNRVNGAGGLVYLSDLGFYSPNSLLDEGSFDWAVGDVSVIANDGTILAQGGNSVTSQYGAVRLSVVGELPPPTAPAGLTAVSHEPTWQQPWNAIELAWQDTSERTIDFSVERRVAGTADWVEITTGWRVTTARDLDVALDTTYDYRVRARGVAGFSDYSNIATATSPATLVDAEDPVVTILTPADGDVVSGNVPISVVASDNVGVTYLDVIVSGPLGTTILGSIGNSTTLDLTWNTRNLDSGRSTIQARASDAINNGGFHSITVYVGSSNPIMRTTIDLSSRTKRGTLTVNGKVRVVDQSNLPVRSAMITGTWTLPDGSKVTRTSYSDSKGVASFSTSGGTTGTYTIDLGSVIKAGYTLDSAGSELSDSITVTDGGGGGGGNGGGKPPRK